MNEVIIINAMCNTEKKNYKKTYYSSSLHRQIIDMFIKTQEMLHIL